jgi:hypothetical protein
MVVVGHMMWVTRKSGKRYFYRSIRVNGKSIKRYVGFGTNAELQASLLANQKRLQRERQTASIQWQTLFQRLDDHGRLLKQIIQVHHELEWFLIEMEFGRQVR